MSVFWRAKTLLPGCEWEFYYALACFHAELESERAQLAVQAEVDVLAQDLEREKEDDACRRFHAPPLDDALPMEGSILKRKRSIIRRK